jgi:hypothetical protein
METTPIQNYDAEKHKETVWVSVQNVTVFKGRVSSDEFVEKAVHKLIELIQDEYGIEEINFEETDNGPVISWQLEGQRLQRSKVLIQEVDGCEYEVTIAIHNIKKA